MMDITHASQFGALADIVRAGDRLAACAQTTGGVAGSDRGLIEAIEQWTKAREALPRTLK